MTSLRVYSVSPIMTNCYLITDDATGKMAVADPGGKSEKLIEDIKSSNGSLEYIILTHGHFDHIGFAKELSDMFGARIVCGENTDKYLSDNSLNLSARHDEVENIIPFKGDILLKDNDKITLGNTEIIYITTPGHTDGCGCYIFDDVIISGDTLFCESFGRTDFETGSFTVLSESLKKLKNLNGDYTVLPGHGLTTSLEHERKYNPLMSRL